MSSSGSHFRLGALLARKPQLSVYAVMPVGLLVGVAALLLLLAWVLLYAAAAPRHAEMNRIAGQLAHQFQVRLISACSRCCYITVDSATTALQNGACTYRCISKQMHYKTPFSHNVYMKSLELYEN
jgi:hypothetical protein